MIGPARSVVTLKELMASGAGLRRSIDTPAHRLLLDESDERSCLRSTNADLQGRSVLLAVGDMAKVAAALIELDGVVRRLVLCPPGVARGVVNAIVRDADVDAVVYDSDGPMPEFGAERCIACELPSKALRQSPARQHQTEWVLLTSGTSSGPKMVVHNVRSLTYAICDAPQTQIWGTFYDIRRFGGLQIFLRALAGTGNLTLTSAREPLEDFLVRLASAGSTHISGTPSQWRLALLCGAASMISPNYIRLSGEIADQPILDALGAAFPHANIVHAFASTEAGVAFEVPDGLAGFPLSYVDRSREPSFTVVEGVLRVRSDGAASHYLGANAPQIRDADGYVDTGDIVERRGDRYEFLGRRDGIINVGGAKVHPEEVEAVINTHMNVRASRVFGHKNRLTGELVAAEVVLCKASDSAETTRDIRNLCHACLAAYKVPFSINVVDSLSITANGKLRRGQ